MFKTDFLVKKRTTEYWVNFKKICITILLFIENYPGQAQEKNIKSEKS